jgi:hypothetical protein
LAYTQQFSGRYRQANDTMRQVFELAEHEKAPDVQAGTTLSNAEARGLAGLCEGNAPVVEQGMSLDKNKQNQETAVLAAAVCGDNKASLPLALDLNKRFPEDTLIQDVYLPLTKAFLALAEGRPAEAVDYAMVAKPYDALYPGSYVQGLAYLQMHNGALAVSAFQSALRSKVSIAQGNAPFYAQAQLGLARAYAMTGNKANAKQNYEAFFLTWKDADTDLPMLLAARKEYAAL